MSEKSKVYFTNLRTGFGTNLQKKLERLIKAAGIGSIDMDGKFVAIKMHFGEPGNLAFLRPNWAKTVADTVYELGGKPYLTDCNTLYVGGRKNALDHLQSAEENGFSPLSTGCQIIIADGLKGSDDEEIEIKGGKELKTAYIGKAIAESDVFISLAHFKGHESTGFGGALKNIGMGSGSRRGKMAMHSSSKPMVNSDLCIGCGICKKICAHDAQVIENGKCRIALAKCVGCGRCLAVCPKDAIEPGSSHSNEMLNIKMMEYAKAVVQDKPSFYINIAIDISPNCDCHDENDAAIVPNIGLFASFDPVAIDKASADAVNKAPIIANTMLDEAEHHVADHFDDLHPETDWKQGLEYASEIGLGSLDYELITIK
jgi:Uncharacterized Fe-S center protein